RIGDDHLPKTVLVAEADTVVGLVAGALTVDQAFDAGELRGEAGALRRAFA
ncbi:HxlR family transcriptional regulator, partial [Enemella dayhoffiae]